MAQTSFIKFNYTIYNMKPIKTGIKVSEAMSTNPVVISKNESITQCARKMLANNVGAIIIKDKDKIEGIITEKDIVEEVVAKELNIKKTKVKDIMTTGMITISPNEDLSKAVDVMIRENVRRLPVIVNQKIVGLLTVKDILNAHPKLFKMLYDCFLLKNVSKYKK